MTHSYVYHDSHLNVLDDEQKVCASGFLDEDRGKRFVQIVLVEKRMISEGELVGFDEWGDLDSLDQVCMCVCVCVCVCVRERVHMC